MYKLTMENTEIELSELLFLGMVENILEGTYWSLESVFISFIFGYPDSITNTHTTDLLKSNALLNEIELQVSTKEIYPLLHQLRVDIQTVVLEEKAIVKWIEVFTGQNSNKIQRLINFGSVQKIGSDGFPTGNTELPEWATRSEYREFMKRASILVESALESIDRLLKILRRTTNNLEEGNSYSKQVDVLAKIADFRNFIHNCYKSIPS